MRELNLRAVLALGLLALGSSTGCLVLAVGAAGTGGYVLGSDDRTVGTVFSDAGITASIKSKLLADSDIKGFQINVDTYEGVVTLHGRVSSRSARRKAASLARDVEGVSSVENELELK